MNRFRIDDKRFRTFLRILLAVTVIGSWILRLTGFGWFLVVYGCLMLIVTALHVGIQVYTIRKASIGVITWVLIISNLLFFLSLNLQFDTLDYSAGIPLFGIEGAYYSYTYFYSGYLNPLAQWVKDNNSMVVGSMYGLLVFTWIILLFYQNRETSKML